jgi:hypothetical protein
MYTALVIVTLATFSMSANTMAVAQQPAAAEATAKLPRGPGLAANYIADKDIASHDDVVFAEDFETENLRQRWDEVRADQPDVLTFVEPQDAAGRLGNRVMRVTATLGKNTGGGVTKWYEHADPVFIRFYVRFDPNCDYVHHFVTLRANKSLQGGDRWSGFGGAGERPLGDGRFSTALEPWGDWSRNPPPGKWNFYSYWHTMTASPDGKFWGNQFLPAEQPNIERGKWICAEFMLKHNTPDQSDGEQAFWIDGELKGHWTGLNWRTSPTLWANALTLEAYITDRWTKQPVNVVEFDNVVIA